MYFSSSKDPTLPYTEIVRRNQCNSVPTPLPAILGAAVIVLTAAFSHSLDGAQPPAELRIGNYRGWTSNCLDNGIVEVHVVPEIGGRVIQYRIGEKEVFWVNPELAGKQPTTSGLDPDDEWLNYGGDKLWPAPQGWDRPDQWPGPPDAVLDGQPYASETIDTHPNSVAVKLTSRKDPHSGIQFSRTIRLAAGSTRVEIAASMKNIDNKPRRWGIWAHTQLNAGSEDGVTPNRLMKAWCPVNRQSRYLKGFDVMFGEPDNPSFGTDWRRGLTHVNYRYLVGKIGIDTPAGWSATVDGRDGTTFVQTFHFAFGREYPDHASVEFWHNGVGKINAFNRDIELPHDPQSNPYIFESELLSPFFALKPGEEATWEYEWCSANIGGDYPIVACNDAGIISDPLTAISDDAKQCRLTGRFGVFFPGQAALHLLGPNGKTLTAVEPLAEVTPLRPLVVDVTVDRPSNAVAAEIRLYPGEGHEPILLARTDLPSTTVSQKWSKERIWKWYNSKPWLVGCDFVPSSAVNDVEMWRADTFDAVTIDRELEWAHELGFNTVRVFLNYVVWRADPDGLKARLDRFLALAERHKISVMPILFDDCNFANRVAAATNQPDRIPGVHNSQWVSSPPLAMVTDNNAKSDLERYAKDIVGSFRNDDRIIIWDLYNEPGNSNLGDRSRPLAEAAFAWAREMKPTQPLTTGAWIDLEGQFSQRLFALSDIISFHGYLPRPGVQQSLSICRRWDRPILCTEWLHRQSGNTVEEILPMFQERRIGCYNWGLVFGRTQTYMPWGSKPGDKVPDVWQHDLFRADGQPYRSEEFELIRHLITRSRKQHR